MTGVSNSRSQTGGKRGRSKISQIKRAAILRGAKAVFLAAGFGGANMDDVAARAGVSKMTVYRHFGSKEDLFAGVITELGNKIVAEDLGEYPAENIAEEALRRFARKMIDIVFDPETIELHRIVVAECHRFPKLGQFFYASGPQVCIDVLARYLRRNRNNPRFRIIRLIGEIGVELGVAEPAAKPGLIPEQEGKQHQQAGDGRHEKVSFLSGPAGGHASKSGRRRRKSGLRPDAHTCCRL